jgi:hypothetical protein
MRPIIAAFLSCALLTAGQAGAQTHAIGGDEYAASRKYCDAKWQSSAAQNAAGGQSHEKFARTCVCDRRWQEKVVANIGNESSREAERRRCLGVLTGSDVPEFAFFGGSTLVFSLLGLTSSDGLSGGQRPVSP